MKKNKPNPNTAPTTQAKGEVRIIAGRWRGRKLQVMQAQGLRPTGDRVKETLFNWLMHDIVGARCLDCFAGSGALGIEALSRQAGSVIFLERERAVAAQLKRNLSALHCESSQAQVITQNSLDFLKLPQNPPHFFDVVFLDPPFHQQLAQQTIELLEQYQWLADNALVYVETEKDGDLAPPAHWQPIKEKVTGMVCYRLYRVGEREG